MKQNYITKIVNNLKFRPTPKKILIINHGNLGDFVHSIRAIKLLNNNFNVYLNTKKEFFEIIPEIKKDIDLNKKYTTIINFNSNKKLDLFLIKNNTFDFLGDKIIKKHILRKWNEIHWSDYYYNKIKELFNLSKTKLNQKKSKKQLIVIHPGSSMKEKNWDLNNFIWIGKKLQKINKVVFLIGPNDKLLKEKILRKKLEIFESNNFKELDKLAKKTKLYIGNDSGPMHFFSLYTCKILGIYTIGCAKTHYPYSNNAWYYYEEDVFLKFYKSKKINKIKLKKETCLKQIYNIINGKRKLEKNFFKVNLEETK